MLSPFGQQKQNRDDTTSENDGFFDSLDCRAFESGRIDAVIQGDPDPKVSNQNDNEDREGKQQFERHALPSLFRGLWTMIDKRLGDA